MTRSLLCALGAVVAVLAAAAPAASAHGGASGYQSTVEAVRPPAPGVEVRVLDGDDRMELRSTGPTVIVLGYDGEPYLRFTPKGVDRNANSAATYLNEARYGEADVPETLESSADARWQRVAAAGAAYDWHDHRIHWMSRTPPRPVRDDPDSAHRIFEWKVPLLVDGKSVAVEGALDYQPSGSSLGRLLLYGGLPALALLVVLALFLRARPVRRR